MAVSSRNCEESKIFRKMSLSYIKDSIVRRRQNGSHACCCETLEDANGETVDSAIACSKREISSDGNVERCKCTGRSLGDKHKLGIFKSLKKRFQINANISGRPINCKSKHTFKSVESSSNYALSLGEESVGEGFPHASTRKSKSSTRVVCPMPPFRFVRNSGNNDKSSPISLTSRDDRNEAMTGSRKVPDVIQNSCPFRSATPEISENRSTDGCVLALPAFRNNIDSGNDFQSQLDRTHNYDTASSDYGEAHKFVLNLDGKGIVQCEPYDLVRHTINQSTEPMPSPTSRSLTCELFKLAKYGWYWGPISREEAEEKLLDLPDGAFLVRDSSADRYLLSVSFRSSGKTFHARIEHSYGLFSFYPTPGGEGFSSIVELINHSMSYSESAVFCYSRPRAPGHPAFPVRLARPVSRFTQVRSLQYLCRFVIRQYTRVDNIQKLPLPNRLKGYIQEGHY